MKTKQIFLLSAILLTALIFAGAGCDDKEKTAPPQDQSAAADVVVEEDVQEETQEEVADTEGKSEEEEQNQSQIPEGWKVYESERLNLSFAYPDNWYVVEDENLGILVSDFLISQPLPPDILGVPVVIGVRDGKKESTENLVSSLKEADPSMVSQIEVINERTAAKYTYRASIDQERTLYSFSSGSDFIEVGVDGDTDPSIIQTILKTLSF